MWYRAGADLAMVVHLLFIGFIVGGGFLAWRWPLIIWSHIPAVVYGALVEFVGFTCPLTLLENDLGQRAGGARLPGRIHLALPGQCDLSTGAHPWDANRARRLASAGGEHRIPGVPAPAWAERRVARALANVAEPDHGDAQ